MPLDLQGFSLPSTDLGLSTSEVVFPVEVRNLLSSTLNWGDESGLPNDVYSVADTHKCIVRTDTEEIIGVVGANYRLLRNEDYFSMIEEVMRGAIPGDMWEGVQVRDSLSRGGAFCRREYVFPAYAEALKNTMHETELGLRVVAWNSYDGGSSAGLTTGLIDFYCTNGLVLGRNIATSALRHSSRMDPRTLVAPLQKSIEQTEEMVTEVRRMAMTPVSNDDVIGFLENSFSSQKAANLFERFSLEVEQRGQNVFSLLSALTYYSSHDSDLFPTMGREGTSMQTLHGREAEVQRLVTSREFSSLLEAAA